MGVKELSEAIRQAREEVLMMTQKELARHMSTLDPDGEGVAERTVVNWEAGTFQRPHNKSLRLMDEAFGWVPGTALAYLADKPLPDMTRDEQLRLETVVRQVETLREEQEQLRLGALREIESLRADVSELRDTVRDVVGIFRVLGAGSISRRDDDGK